MPKGWPLGSLIDDCVPPILIRARPSVPLWSPLQIQLVNLPSSCILVPEFDHEGEAFECLSQRVEEIFEEYLDGWYRYRRIGRLRAMCQRSGTGRI